IPHAAVVARDGMEAVMARRKVVVERVTTRSDVLPVAVPAAFELDAKPILFWRDQAERRVVDLQIARQRGQTDASIGALIRIVRLSVGDNLLDVHRRRKCVGEKVPRIDHADAILANEPQSSIRALGDLRTEPAGKGTASYSVRTVENHYLNHSQPIVVQVLCGGPAVQLVA